MTGDLFAPTGRAADGVGRGGGSPPGKQATSLASIYHAKKSGDTSVGLLKRQFQTQLERVSHDRGQVPNAYIPTSNDREVNAFKKLNREKSFDEARTAVQSQIERIFQKAKAAKNNKDGEANGNSIGSDGGGGFVGGGGGVEVVSPLPVHGITLKTLIDTRKSETIAEATEPPSSADEVSRRGQRGSSSRQSTLSRHASMDNLQQRSSPTRAGQQYARHGQQHRPQPSPKYTSMMNLNTSHGNEHESLRTLKRSKKREAAPPVPPPVAAKPPIAAGMSTAQRRAAAAKTAPTTPNQPPAPARDASLQFLGRMSPEEQLNKFLKSVEEVNAENLGRLRRRKDKDARASSLTDNSSSSGAEAALKRMTGPVLHSRARAMRRESQRRDSRWHSMDNLSNMKQTLKQQLQQQHLLHTPARSRKPPLHSATSSNSSSHPQPPPPGGEGTPAKPSRRKQRQESPMSPKAVGFREVNGPSKAFSSMSQLDNLRGGNHENVRFSDPISSSSATSTSVVAKSKRNSRGSPMETTSSSSHSRTASSTEMDANGNRKSKGRVTEISPPPPMPPAQPMPTSSAIVSYLGSIALNSQASDLTSLQLPLKELYYKYMSNEIPPLSNSRLDITDTGLRVLYRQGPSGRQAEIFNPFPSIAVWAAVRFVYKRASPTNEPGKFLFAFLPLISDPGDTEKNQLYSGLSKKDVKLAVSNEHPAMFACIMRRMGSSRKQLECHGFVCDSKEDAIMIAANLYRSLMETMKRQQELEEEGATTEGATSSATFWSDTTPSRPPRKKKSKKSSSKNSRSQSMDDATSQMDTAVDEDLQQSNTMRRKKQSLGRSHSAKISDHGDSYKRRVKRSASERRSVADEEEDQEELSEEDEETGTVRRRKKGDVFTKVAMPRSKSFMNVSGPYNLQELFKELKDKEGIESVDDILRQVISREGMSFNRTSPMYRELLMKLAMSLSADEMFIRSKNIMMQEKSKSVNREESSAFARVFGGLFGRNKNKQSASTTAITVPPKVSKADIGGPLPVSEEARRELTKQWMKVTPQLAELSHVKEQLKSAKSNTTATVLSATTATSSGSSGNNNKGKAVQNNNNNSSNNNRNKSRSRSREHAAASAHSCSECGGYQSTSQFSRDAYSMCSCSLTTTAVDTMVNSDEYDGGGFDGESTAPSSASAMKAGRKRLAPKPPPKRQPDPKQVTSTRSRIRRQAAAAAARAHERDDDLESTAATTVSAATGVSCSTCGLACTLCAGETTCYSCTSGVSSSSYYSGTENSRTTQDEETESSRSSTEGASSFTVDSPQTAWKLRQEEMLRGGAPGNGMKKQKQQQQISSSSQESSSESEEEEEEESEEDDDTSNTSVLSVVRMRTSGDNASGGNSRGGDSSTVSSKKGAEHVDGFFRNLNAMNSLEDKQQQQQQQLNRRMSFHNVNATVARQSSKAGVTGQQHQQPQKQQQQGKGALISADSLSSSESSSSSSDISEDSMAHGRKGPRPAYSMSNMHNSLGYLP